MIAIQFIVTFIILAIMGMLNSGYLVWAHRQDNKKALVCPLDHDCSVVTESKWSHIFYFRNDTLGFLFFIATFVAIITMLLLPLQVPLLSLLILIAASGAFLFTLFLLYLQAFVIKDYCFYCLISATITILLFINSIAVYIAR